MVVPFAFSEKLPFFHATIQDRLVQTHWHYHAFCHATETLPVCQTKLRTDPLTRLHPVRHAALKPQSTYTLYAKHARFWGKRSDYIILPCAVKPLCVPNLLRVTLLPNESP